MQYKDNEALSWKEKKEYDKSFAEDLAPSDEHSIELQSVRNFRSITGFATAI